MSSLTPRIPFTSFAETNPFTGNLLIIPWAVATEIMVFWGQLPSVFHQRVQKGHALSVELGTQESLVVTPVSLEHLIGLHVGVRMFRFSTADVARAPLTPENNATGTIDMPQ
jgi:hypothetical protein